MKPLQMTMIAVVTALLAGCSSSVNQQSVQQGSILGSAEQAKAQLAQANSCCQSFADFSYQPLEQEDNLLVLDGKQASFRFDEGMSYFAAYRLPTQSADLAITIASQVSKSVMIPKVILLDSQFKVTRVLGDSVFSYQSARLLDNDRIEGRMRITRQANNPASEAYMIIYAPGDKLAGSTTILHPSKAFARAHGTVEPNIKDPVIPHSPWGVVQISMEDLSKGKGVDALFKAEYADKVALSQGVQPTVAAAPVVASAPAISPEPVPAMLKETEQFYQTQIEKAVNSGDIDKALQLVNEAQRAGSVSAKSVFVEAVKRSQK